MQEEDLNKVFWVFNTLNFNIIPSYYVSGVLPSNYLKTSKLVFLEGHDPEQTLNNIDAKVLILLKAFDNSFFKLAKSAKKRGIKIISVFDDWYFQNIERTKINFPLASVSDVVIVKTNSAALELNNYFKIKAKIISDPIRFKKNKIFRIDNKKLNLCWFGTRNNHDTIINELKNLEKIKLQINITIISNFIDLLKKELTPLNIVNLNIVFKYWHENADLDIVKSEIVILPYPNDKKRFVKSSNRIIDSLNLGRFTILSPVPQFKEFKNFVYFGKIYEGILWFTKNKLIAKEKTLLGQKYVDDNYSLESISNKWRDLL